MTPADKADLAKLAADKRFQRFLYSMIQRAGLLTVAPAEGRSLEFIEGRRSLALDLLADIEATQATPSPDGLPIFTSIQIFLNVAQSAAKEKDLGRRSDIYGDLSSGDGDGE